MTTTIIIPFYKDLEALELILQALKQQSYKSFEVVIAEDDDAKETKEFLDDYNLTLSIKHFTQKDDGNQKARILNKVLANIKSDYIIFIDGDTIPYTTFVQSHIELSQEKTVLYGRRVNLGDKVSNDLRNKKITPQEIEKSYIKKFYYLNDDNIRHYEQGIRLKPKSFLHNFITKRDKNTHIVGSNFSCFKKDLDYINGFDEDIVGGSKDDVDLEWRLVKSGCKLKSAKFCANLFHLNHSRASRIDDIKTANKQMEQNKKNNIFICKNGIRK
jgi:glycosyltransferase involved in cell wall biosynthesis